MARLASYLIWCWYTYRELRSLPDWVFLHCVFKCILIWSRMLFFYRWSFSLCHIYLYFSHFLCKEKAITLPLIVFRDFSLGLQCYFCYHSFLETFLFVVLWNARTAYLHQFYLSGIVCPSRNTYQWWKNIACLRAVISDKRTSAEKKGKGYFTMSCRDIQKYVLYLWFWGPEAISIEIVTSDG